MPVIFIHCPKGTFSNASKPGLSSELTGIALSTEGLPDTTFLRSTAWIYFNEYEVENVFRGGQGGGRKVISIEVSYFKGALDDQRKELLISQFTDAVRRHAGIADSDLVPVYILLKAIDPSDWGVFGSRITFDDLRHPSDNAQLI